MSSDKRILVLGGVGLVGSQVVREIARVLEPERIIVASFIPVSLYGCAKRKSLGKTSRKILPLN